MAGNRAVAYKGPGKVEVIDTEYPEFELKDAPGINTANIGRKVPHGVILRTVSTNICGSDQHMVRGRTTAPTDLVLGHEITGEVVECGPDVEFIKVGDIVSVPFNISCGRCRNCKERKTGICLNVNPDRPGSAYGYVDMGGWVGGQAEYVLVPYADWNLLKFPDRDQALEKIMDLTMLSDILPTGYHGVVTAGVGVGSTVYIAGAGPVGLAAAAAAHLLGAAVVIVGDMNEERLAQARSFGCETVDVSQGPPAEQIEQILGVPEVDCGVDAVGFEARGHGKDASHEAPATVLNSLMDITAAGGALGIPGLYVTGDPGAVDEAAQKGSLSISLGTGWAKSLSFTTGQCPVMKYNRQLMMAILHDKIQIAKAVNARAIPLEDAPRAPPFPGRPLWNTGRMARKSNSSELLQTVDQVTEEAINVGYRLEQRIHRFRQRRAEGRGDIPVMVAFEGYGSQHHVRVLGRALLKTRGLIESTDESAESIRGWRSFTSVPIAFAHVNVWIDDYEFHLVADKGGVVDVDLQVSLPPGEHTVWMQTEGSDVVEARVFVVADEQRIGVVSDVDDTVMVTALPRPMLAAWNSFVLNEHARTPTPGMAVMMDRLLHRHHEAPFVYLSTGAWNVAPTLRRFLTRNAYPAGALLLTDWGPTTDRWFRAGSAHKVHNLERLARNFPHVRWILIGDDGQHDPEIYSGFVHRYPEHVAAIVIRTLSPAEAVLAGNPLVNEERRVSIPEGTLWIEGNDGASISRQLAEHGLL